MKRTWKKAAAFVLAIALAAGAMPANVGNGGQFGSTAIVARAAAEECEIFDTVYVDDDNPHTYTGSHFKIEVEDSGDGDGFFLFLDHGAIATITALNGETITRIELVPGYGDDVPTVNSRTAVRSVTGGVFTYSNVNDSSISVTGCFGNYGELQIKQVKVYYGEADATDISTAAINLASDNRAASLMMDETRINIYHGFDITYGTDESHTATEVPTTAGTYYAYVTPNASNTAYTGTAKSAAFTISPTAYNSGTVSVGDLKVGDILGPGVTLTKDTSSENSQFLDIDTIYGLIAALFRRGESFTASVTEEGLYAEYGYLYETDDEIDYETDDVTDDETDDETDIGTDGENRNVLVDTFRNGNNAYVVKSISYAGDEFNGYNVDWDSDEYILEQTTAVLPAVTEDDPPVSGGWEFSDIAADSVDASDKAALEAALQGMDGVTYEPKDVIAAQTVAGRNLAFLCKATPVTPDPRSYWAIVSVSMDLQGKVSLNKISAVDPADMKVKENAEESAPGSWTSEAKETAAELPESVQKAVGSVTGVQYTPIAVLGTQLAAGKNYCILAYGTTATASPVTSLYALYVYENPDGTAEVNAISALDLAAYVTPEKEFFASAEELGNMAKIDYEKKTGTACYVAESVLNADETEVTVKLTNADGTLLETYIIDPYTGEGKSASGAAVDLPQTGNTSPLAAAAASGALLMVLSGIFTAMRSGLIRKKDSE